MFSLKAGNLIKQPRPTPSEAPPAPPPQPAQPAPAQPALQPSPPQPPPQPPMQPMQPPVLLPAEQVLQQAQWAQQQGGFASVDTINAWLAFVKVVAMRYAHLVDEWITLNEPVQMAFIGYKTLPTTIGRH